MATNLEDLVPAKKLRTILNLTPNGELYQRANNKLPEPIRVGRQNYYLRSELEAKLGLIVPEGDVSHD